MPEIQELNDEQSKWRVTRAGVSAPELQDLLEKLGHPIDVSAVDSIFEKYDLDSSGKIEFPEFLRLFRQKFLHIDVRSFSYPLLYLAAMPVRS